MSKPWVLDHVKLAMRLMERHPKHKEHDYQLEEILRLIFRGISQEVNYDHIITSIPKSNIPLEYRGKRYDISFVKDGRIFYVQLDSEPLEYQERQGE